MTFITPARFLFNAGKTPKDWNKKILSDEHFKVIKYFPNSTDVFPNVDIKGGVTITLRNKKIKYEKIKTFIVFDELKTILSKVLSKNFCSFSKLIYAPESYKLTKILHEENKEAKKLLSQGHLYDLTTNIFERLPDLFHDIPLDAVNSVGIVGRLNNQRVIKWIKASYIADHENLKKYKVFIPKSNGSGTLGELLSTPMIGQPMIGHTQTFISIGKFESKEEAQACLKYVETKFVRCLLGTLKVTQDNKKNTWNNVPMQDFSSDSDIDWTKSVKEIDDQLYRKYGLTDKEITFIEKKNSDHGLIFYIRCLMFCGFRVILNVKYFRVMSLSGR